MLISILGKPIAKKRPRFVRRGNYVGAYNDQETEEGKWILMAKSQINELIKRPTPIMLSCEFFMPIPKTTSRKRANMMRNGDIKHTKKPDLDNLVKFVKDCLNGLAWEDDSQVFYLTAFKRYGEPQTIISITKGENQ